MKTKNKALLGAALLMTIIVFLMFGIGKKQDIEPSFECHARVYTKQIANNCNKSSMVNVFLSMRDGKGELLVSGTHSCPRTPLVTLLGIARFAYTREGSYYLLHMEPRSPEVIELFDVLKEDYLKLKITPLNSYNYVIETPIKTVLLCTTE